jgi:hypothetical protein
MPSAIAATVFGILGLIAVWSIRNNIAGSSPGWIEKLAKSRRHIHNACSLVGGVPNVNTSTPRKGQAGNAIPA